MRKTGWILAALAAAACPCRAIEPTSNVRVEVDSAAVTGLECRRRPFRMEWTRSVGLRYSKAAAESFRRDPDLRTVSLGLFAMVLMTPMAVLAVPADLAAAPWRRECDFDLRVDGCLAGWAGSPVGGERLAVQGRGLVDPGLDEYLAPRYLVNSSTAAADEAGRFVVSLPGRVGRSPAFELRWFVEGRPSGLMTLRKSGGRFRLSEPEPEFGASDMTMSPIDIRPARAESPRPARSAAPD
jgi:hypothetical protein